MQAIAEIEVTPVDHGLSARETVKRAIEVLDRAELQTRPHALGTEVEGDLTTVLDAVAEIHRSLHESGAVRLKTHLTIGTRLDKVPSLTAAEKAVRDDR